VAILDRVFEYLPDDEPAAATDEEAAE
jgi:hypothetical protein